MRPLPLRRLLPAAALLAALAAPACGKEAPAGLVLAVATDMVVPDDISAVALIIDDAATGARIGDPVIRAAAPSKAGKVVRFPATMNLLTAFDGGTFSEGSPIVSRVQISFVGLRGPAEGNLDNEALKGLEVRVLRRVIATMPKDGLHLLRLNLGALDAGAVAPIKNPSTGAERVANALDLLSNRDAVLSSCPAGEESVSGICRKILEIDGDALTPYAAEAVFGGGASPETGACFDVARCFDPRRRAVEKLAVTLGKDGCTAPLPASVGARPNLAYERTGSASLSDAATSFCVGDANGRHCLFRAPASDATGAGEEGYSVVGDRIRLPLGVCRALDARRIDGLWASRSDDSRDFVGACPLAGPEVPVCGPSSGVGAPSTAGLADAGVVPERAFPYAFEGDFLAVCIAYGLPAGQTDGGDPGLPVRFKVRAKYDLDPAGKNPLQISFTSLPTVATTLATPIGATNGTSAIINPDGTGTAVAKDLLIPHGSFTPLNPDTPNVPIDVGGSSADFALRIKNNARFCANLTVNGAYYSALGVKETYDKPVTGPCFFVGPYDDTYVLPTFRNEEITCP